MGIDLVRRSRPILWVMLSILSWMVVLLPFFNYVESGERGLALNRFTGEVNLQEPGLHWSAPWVWVAVVDARPQRLCVPSTAHAAPTCRLVQFDVGNYHAFIATEGWGYYWFRNRLSFNSGYRTERGFRDVLRGYAFSQSPYPFIKELK